jgi:hypothetical protein
MRAGRQAEERKRPLTFLASVGDAVSFILRNSFNNEGKRMGKKKAKEPKRDPKKECDDYRKEKEKKGETPG